jgi:hypothetical protein
MLRPPVNQDRRERNFDIVSSIFGNNIFPRGLTQEVGIERLWIGRPRHAELDLVHRHGEPQCKTRLMERFCLVACEGAAPDIARASAVGANVQSISRMEAVAQQSRNVHAAAGLASNSGRIASPRRHRRDKCVIVSPLRGGGPPRRCATPKSTPLAGNSADSDRSSCGIR